MKTKLYKVFLLITLPFLLLQFKIQANDLINSANTDFNYQQMDNRLSSETDFHCDVSCHPNDDGSIPIFRNREADFDKPNRKGMLENAICARRVLWYMVGNCIGSNDWDNGSGSIGTGLIPLLPKPGAGVDADGNTVLVYAGYFPAGGQFKFVRDPGNWDTQMNFTNIDSNEAGVTDEDGDNHNIGIPEDGFYYIEMNTVTNKVTIMRWTGANTEYETITMPGDYQGWDPGANAMNAMGKRDNTETHDWYLDATYDANAELKFANGSWDANWGASDFPLGYGTQGGPNIPVRAGTYRIYFNDCLGLYYFIGPEDILYCNGTVCTRGVDTQTVLAVELINENQISAIQCDITLPSIATMAQTGNNYDVWLDETRKSNNHAISTTYSSGKYRIVISSPTGKALKGNSGNVFYFRLNVDTTTPGTYMVDLSNIVLSTTAGERIELDDISANLVTTYLSGDVNADGNVDVADYVQTCNKILDKNPSPFYNDAGDLDGDGTITVIDLVRILRISLNVD